MYPKLTDAHVVVVVMVVVVVEGSHDPDLKHAVKAAAYLTQSLFVFDAVWTTKRDAWIVHLHAHS